jgi:hypothetical protein
MDIAPARRQLAALWFLGSAPSFLCLAARTLAVPERFDVQGAWGWLLPTLLPSLSLMVGVIALGPPQQPRDVDPFLLALARWLSAIYLALVLASLLFAWAKGSELKTANLFLGPLQGLVAGVLTFFFGRAASPREKKGRHRKAELRAGEEPDGDENS